MLVTASPWTILCAAAGLVLAPAIPTSIAIFLAFCLSAASSRFRHANLAYIVISLVAFAALFVGMYAFSFAANANGHEQTMSQVEGALSTASNALSAGWPARRVAVARYRHRRCGAVCPLYAERARP